jgi:succinate dehydrogenase/fumarate reductase flavoprotein subunit
MGAMVLSKPLPMRDEAMRLMTSAISEGRGTANGGLAWYVGDSPRGAENVQKKLNTAQYNYIRANGYEPSRERIEVAPGAHYLMGGIHINEQCETTVQGLFATPECAGNIDGANRLGGNGLMATQVFGARAGLSAHRWACYNPRLEADAGCLEGEMARITVKLTSGNGAGTEITGLRKNLRSAVQKYAGVRRDRAGLKRLINAIDEVHTNLVQIKVPDIGVYNQPLIELLQLEGMCETASMIANCALLREESRGHHFRNDFPQQNDIKWLKHTSIIRGEQGPKYDTRPVVELQNF